MGDVSYDERENLLDLTAVEQAEDLNRFEPFFFLNHYRFDLIPRTKIFPAWPPSGATPDSTTKDYTNGKYCWKVWIHPNHYSRLAQEPWIESPGNGRRPLSEILTDGCRNRNHIPLDLDGGFQVS
ncbi:hypothetical protein AVEN_235511-1 [Araneus ventricosus]|uniref:Uncharacterized protein n=1 Tax=Araneus ventricosus TaxID=182803 RepID=A0A4Y2A6P6_ARAVE|nr:hypothetical protein AVEN_235511-1 [Araneus ventricosus]